MALFNGQFVIGKTQSNGGFTLIELMVVVAIIGILASIAISNFLGMQEKAKRRATEESAASAKAELHSWLVATENGESGVLDVNGDGIITQGERHVGLATAVASWLQAYVVKHKGVPPRSPWNNVKNIFTVTATNPANTGQIALSVLNNGRGVKIVALDHRGNIVFNDSVSIE